MAVINRQAIYRLLLAVGSLICISQGFLTSAEPLRSPSGLVFEDSGAQFIPWTNGSVNWGDFDNDHDLDCVIAGEMYTGQEWTSGVDLYQNDGGNFVEIEAGLAPVRANDSAWGDFDRDGDLDLLIAGEITTLYRNDGTSPTGWGFTPITTTLPGISFGSVDWGDYDNDGDLDILITSSFLDGTRSKIYRNDGTASDNSWQFTNANAGLVGTGFSDAKFGDYDNDDDLDILIQGCPEYEIYCQSLITRVYRNDDGVYVNANAGLLGLWNGSVDWGDFDNDSDLDILLTGDNWSTSFTKIYRNDGSHFTDTNTNLTTVTGSAASWGDYDNDGDLDILETGSHDRYSQQPITKVYRNDDGLFTDIENETGIKLTGAGASNWGDYDNDGDLDILLSGWTGQTGIGIAKLYRNTNEVANTPPSSPIESIQTITGVMATLSWQPSTDAQTLSAGLTYNLRVGTTPGGLDVVSPMSLADGYRLVAQPGNVGQATTAILVNLKFGQIYYWSVQAVDTAFAGSAFSEEASFIILPAATLYFPLVRR